MKTGEALFLGAAIAVSLLFFVVMLLAGKPFGGWCACLGVSVWSAATLSQRGPR